MSTIVEEDEEEDTTRQSAETENKGEHVSWKTAKLIDNTDNWQTVNNQSKSKNTYDLVEQTTERLVEELFVTTNTIQRRRLDYSGNLTLYA